MNINTYSNTNFKRDNEEVKGKVIRKAALARQILRTGGEAVRIIDLKGDRDNSQRTVFVFRDDDKFQEVFAQVLEENHKNRRDSENENLKRQLEDMQKKFDELLKNTTAKE